MIHWVASLEREWYELVAGTYMDEFAESHAKEMVVRESVSGMVPSAGVGTCFSRKALTSLIGATHNKPFNINSLTEDYDVGMRLAGLGMESIFGVFPVTFRVRRGWAPRQCARLLVNMPLCVRNTCPLYNFRLATRRSPLVLGHRLQTLGAESSAGLACARATCCCTRSRSWSLIRHICLLPVPIHHLPWACRPVVGSTTRRCRRVLFLAPLTT